MFDFAAFVSTPRYYANYEPFEPFETWCFQRPDGTFATCVGTPVALLCIDGQHTSETCGYDKLGARLPKLYPHPSGKGVDHTNSKATVPLGTVSLELIRSFVGSPIADPGQKEVRCPTCNGRGEVECYHCYQDMGCEDCDGTGKLVETPDVPERFIRIDGRFYSRNHLAPLLATLPDCPVKLIGDNRGFLLLVGDGWKLAIMAISGIPESDADVVNLPLLTQEAIA